MNSLRFTFRIFLFAAVFSLAAGHSSNFRIGSLCAQETDDAGVAEPETVAPQEPQDDELPKGAIWRFGEYGEKTQANGYYRLAYSPNGKLLAARNADHILEIYDVSKREKITSINWYKEKGWIIGVSFSPDSKFVVLSVEEPNNTTVWNTQTGEKVCELETQSSEAYFSTDGEEITTYGSDSVERFAFPSGDLIKKQKWKERNQTRRAMSRDGRVIAYSEMITRDRFDRITVFNLEQNSKIVLPGPVKAVNSFPPVAKSVKFSPNGLWVAACFNHPESKIWLSDLRDPQNSNYILNGHELRVQTLSFTPDNRFLISTGWDKKVVVWDILTREKVGEFNGHSEHVNSSSVSPLNFRIASGASGFHDSSVIEWDLFGLLFPEDVPQFDSFDTAWQELGSNFPRQSLNATKVIVDSSDKWLDALEQRLTARNIAVSQDNIARWIQELSNRKFAVREKATAQLLESRGPAEMQLRQALEDTTLAEVKSRISMILKRPIKRPKIRFDELRRLHRGIFALELIGTERAFEILEVIATGCPDIDLAKDASESLERARQRQLALGSENN